MTLPVGSSQPTNPPVYVLQATGGPAASTTAEALVPQEVYNGGYTNATDVLLRLGNGGAGQSGLVGALANAFIQYCVQQGNRTPFLVSPSTRCRY